MPYEITGRVQIQHEAGGIWDEWYVAFRDGKRWGWLAEAQGRYYLTFPKKLSADHPIPEIADLQVEDKVMVPGAGHFDLYTGDRLQYVLEQTTAFLKERVLKS